MENDICFHSEFDYCLKHVQKKITAFMKVEFLQALLQILPLGISGFGKSAFYKLQHVVLGADVKYQVK